MTLIGNIRKPIGKTLFVCHPVSQTGLIIHTSRHPAVVNDKQLCPHLLHLRDQTDQLLLIHIKKIRIPRIVDNRENTVSLVLLFPSRQNMVILPVIENLTHALKTAIGEPGSEHRRLKAFFCCKGNSCGKIIDTTGHITEITILIVYRNLAISAPVQRTKVNFTCSLRCTAVFIQCKERDLLCT